MDYNHALGGYPDMNTKRFMPEPIIPASLVAEVLAFVTANTDRPGGATLLLKLEEMIGQSNERARGT